MRLLLTLGLALGIGASAVRSAEDSGSATSIYPDLQKYVQQRVSEFDQISNERKAQLKTIALYVKGRIDSKETARLTFICTHNSRRSHMSQIWASAAARHYGVPQVETFSGGTEATAFNPRAIAAVERTGFKVEKIEDGKNPRYAVRFQPTDHPLICFSKVYSDASNPKEDFCAVMTCTQADKNCPTVNGCSARIALPFDDPKIADNTPEEAAKYDERCAQISRELLYVFSQVDK